MPKRSPEPEGIRWKNVALLGSLPVVACLAVLLGILFVDSRRTRARIRQANEEVAAAVERAHRFRDSRNDEDLAKSEDELTACLGSSHATNKNLAEDALKRVKDRRAAVVVEQGFDNSRTALAAGKVTEATAGMSKYLDSPLASRKKAAEVLLAEIREAQNGKAALALLTGLREDDFSQFEDKKEGRNPKVKHPVLVLLWNQTLADALPEARRLRQKAKERAEAERVAQLEKEEQEKRRLLEKEKKRREFAKPKDGTADFPRIVDFYEKHIGRNYYVKGFFFRRGLSRNREWKCYPIDFVSNKAGVTGGPYREKLSFIVTEAMGEKLLDMRNGQYDAIVHMSIRYLDEKNAQYPVGYVTKIEFEDLDLETVKRYIRITLTADGKGQVHPKPTK